MTNVTSCCVPICSVTSGLPPRRCQISANEAFSFSSPTSRVDIVWIHLAQQLQTKMTSSPLANNTRPRSLRRLSMIALVVFSSTTQAYTTQPRPWVSRTLSTTDVEIKTTKVLRERRPTPKSASRSGRVPGLKKEKVQSQQSKISTPLSIRRNLLPEQLLKSLRQDFSCKMDELLDMLIRSGDDSTVGAYAGISLLMIATHVFLDANSWLDEQDLALPAKWAATNAFFVTVLARYVRSL